MEKYLLLSILILHIVLYTALLLRLSRRDVEYLLPFWALFVPVFGPVSAMIGIHIEAKGRDYTELRDFVKGMRKKAYNYRFADTHDVLSAEEVLLINNNQDRRKAMMDIMQTQIRPYLEVLKLAAFNSDVEVSHYATASIMQIQNEFQNGLNSLYANVFSDDASEEATREYIKLLDDYIESGLLNEALAYRQRLTLKSVVEEAIRKYGCRDLKEVQVKNLIALNELTEAEKITDEALKEEITEVMADYRLQLYVLLHDHKGLQEFLEKIKPVQRMFSPALRDKIRFWQDKSEDSIKSEIPLKPIYREK